MSLREVIAQMRQTMASLGGEAAVLLQRLAARAIRGELRRLAGAGSRVWTPAAARAVVDRLRRMLVRLVAQLGAALGKALTSAAATSLADAALFFETGDRALLGHVLPLRPVAPTPAQIGLAREGVFKASLGRFGALLVHAVEGAAVATVLLGKPHRAGVDHVALALRRTAAAHAWELQRIAETEASAAYNAAQLEVLLAQDVPGDRMMKRLVATFDSRTGRDSVLLHGQVRPVREPFFDSHRGHFYMAPPNRPNDRELMVGHRPAWGEVVVDRWPVAEDRRAAPAPAATRRVPGQAIRSAKNLRAGDVLAAPGRPRIASVAERGGRIEVRTEQGLLLYFAAGAAIGVLAAS